MHSEALADRCTEPTLDGTGYCSTHRVFMADSGGRAAELALPGIRIQFFGVEANFTPSVFLKVTGIDGFGEWRC